MVLCLPASLSISEKPQESIPALLIHTLGVLTALLTHTPPHLYSQPSSHPPTCTHSPPYTHTLGILTALLTHTPTRLYSQPSSHTHTCTHSPPQTHQAFSHTACPYGQPPRCLSSHTPPSSHPYLCPYPAQFPCTPLPPVTRTWEPHALRTPPAHPPVPLLHRLPPVPVMARGCLAYPLCPETLPCWSFPPSSGVSPKGEVQLAALASPCPLTWGCHHPFVTHVLLLSRCLLGSPAAGTWLFNSRWLQIAQQNLHVAVAISSPTGTDRLTPKNTPGNHQSWVRNTFTAGLPARADEVQQSP